MMNNNWNWFEGKWRERERDLWANRRQSSA